MERKYENFDLILGGYGGESLRAKYNDQSIPEYYSAKSARRLFHDEEYENNIQEKIAQYPSIGNEEQFMNYIYTVDRMRIWGGAWISMAHLYGDMLHPFMDWYLINPIFSKNPHELKGGKYQSRLINYFAPQLDEIPINKLDTLPFRYKRAKRKAKDIVKSQAKNQKIIKYLGIRVKNMAKYITEDDTNDFYLEDFYDEYNVDSIENNIFSDMGINVDDIEKSMTSKFATINESYLYVTDQ